MQQNTVEAGDESDSSTVSAPSHNTITVTDGNADSMFDDEQSDVTATEDVDAVGSIYESDEEMAVVSNQLKINNQYFTYVSIEFV